MSKPERERLKKAASSRGETLSDCAREMMARGLNAEEAIAAIRSEMRAHIERQEALIQQQVQSVEAVMEMLRQALAPGAG